MPRSSITDKRQPSFRPDAVSHQPAGVNRAIEHRGHEDVAQKRRCRLPMHSRQCLLLDCARMRISLPSGSRPRGDALLYVQTPWTPGSCEPQTQVGSRRRPEGVEKLSQWFVSQRGETQLRGWFGVRAHHKLDNFDPKSGGGQARPNLSRGFRPTAPRRLVT